MKNTYTEKDTTQWTLQHNNLDTPNTPHIPYIFLGQTKYWKKRSIKVVLLESVILFTTVIRTGWNALVLVFLQVLKDSNGFIDGFYGFYSWSIKTSLLYSIISSSAIYWAPIYSHLHKLCILKILISLIHPSGAGVYDRQKTQTLRHMQTQYVLSPVTWADLPFL